MIYTVTTHGKCIITGEHAVLRGESACVFPVKSRYLTLTFTSSNSDVTASFQGEFATNAQMLFWSVLEKGLSMTGHHLNDIHGHFMLDNHVPIGCGMGASAALCSALSQWFCWNDWISSDKIFEFAKDLENLFHGKSSGVDIAASMANAPIVYSMGHPIRQIQPTWSPLLYLTYSGQIGVTSQCVEKVNQLWIHNPTLAHRIDVQMGEASSRAIEALSSDEINGLSLFARALNEARICFTQWGLTPETVEHHINSLLSQGALAAKPTGSGNGGYVLSLWEKPIIRADAMGYIPVYV